MKKKVSLFLAVLFMIAMVGVVGCDDGEKDKDDILDQKDEFMEKGEELKDDMME